MTRVEKGGRAGDLRADRTNMTIVAGVQTIVKPSSKYAWAWALERHVTDPITVRTVRSLTLEGIAAPRGDELVLWFGLPSGDAAAGLLGFLSEDERIRAGRFRLDSDRWAFAAAHAGLRLLLGSMLAAPPLALRFVTAANGKPHLHRANHGPAVQFSISHSQDCVAIAIAACAVGIDLEWRREVPDLMGVARTAFGPEGQAALAACLDRDAQKTLFYRYWTLSEAFIKATGEGMGQDLTSFAFTEKGAPALIRVSPAWGPKERWRFDCDR